MIEVLGDALTLLMPRFMSNRIVHRNIKKYLLEMIDRQAGRIRWSFVERLQKSRLEFRWQMLARIDEAIKGIREAVQKGIESRKRGAEEAKRQEKEVGDELNRLYSLRDSVLSIKEEAGGG